MSIYFPTSALLSLLPYPIPQGTLHYHKSSRTWLPLHQPVLKWLEALVSHGDTIGFTTYAGQTLTAYKAKDLIPFTWGDLRSYLARLHLDSPPLVEVALFLALSDNPEGMLDYVRPSLSRALHLRGDIPFALRRATYNLVKEIEPDLSKLRVVAQWARDLEGDGS